MHAKGRRFAAPFFRNHPIRLIDGHTRRCLPEVATTGLAFPTFTETVPAVPTSKDDPPTEGERSYACTTGPSVL